MKNVILLILLIYFSCSSSYSLSLDDLKKSPSHTLEFYTSVFSQDLNEKIKPIPSHLLNRLIKMDNNINYEPYYITENEFELFEQYFSLLPEKFQTAIRGTTVGIYFVKNFMGGGMTDFLFDTDGKILTVLYLNPEIFSQSLTDWITYRDSSSFFSVDKVMRIEAVCSSEYKGLIHTLLHEACHIYDYTAGYTPYVEPILEQYKKYVFLNDFVKNVWINYNLPLETYDYINRLEISSYGLKPPIKIEKSIEIFNYLKKTPFTSLYGTKNWAEDFAESFTWYYIKTKLKVDYTVVIFNKDIEVMRVNQMSNNLVIDRMKNQFLEITGES